jgi:hypothetical protein
MLQITASRVLDFLRKYKEEVPQLVKQGNWIEVFSYHLNGSLVLDDFYRNCGEDFQRNRAWVYLTGILAEFKLMRDTLCPSGDERQITNKVTEIVDNRLPWIMPSLEALAESEAITTS